MEKGEAQRMFFSRAIPFDDEGPIDAVAAAEISVAFQSAEARFIDKLKAGEADAFDLLVTRFSGDVYALLYRLTGNAEEASDLTQDTFLSALTSIKGFRGEAGLRTWLFRIAINHSRNRFRWWQRRRRDVTVSLDQNIGDGERTVNDTIPAAGKSPEESAISNERDLALIRALKGLPDIFREAIVLCDLEGLSYEEIASALGANIGTVKSRIARGREELRKRLKDF